MNHLFTMFYFFWFSIKNHYLNKFFIEFQGNFDQYIRTRSELEENQMKRYKWEQDQISSMKVRCYFANLFI